MWLDIILTQKLVRMKKLLNILLYNAVALIAVSLVSCSSVDEPKAINKKEIVFSRSETDVNDNVNDFSLKFADVYFKNNDYTTNPNPVVSPLGTSICLAIIANTCGGDLVETIQNNFGYEDIDELNGYMQKLVSGLPCNTDSCRVILANSVWHSAMINPTNHYRDIANDYYKAGIEEFKSTTAETADAINRWSIDKTDNAIGNIVNAESLQQSAAFIVNALSFKAQWDCPFDKKQTAFEIFHGIKQVVSTPMMHQVITTGYYKTDSWESLVLPYKDYDYAMITILPTEDSPISQLHITQADIDSIYKHPKAVKAQFSMPKFDLKAGNPKSLDKTLENMNFSLFADMSGMTGSSTDPLSVVMEQSCSVSVDEEGTIATAVTTGNLITTSTYVPSIEFVINRPFCYIIRNNRTGSIVMAGQYTQP